MKTIKTNKLFLFIANIIIFFFSVQSLGLQNLDGTYYQTCNASNEGDYYEQYLNIDKGHIHWKFIAYEDAECNSPYLIFLREYVIESVNETIVNTAFKKASYVSITDEVTRSLNIIRYCGLNGWKTNVARDVTGLKCDEYQQRQLGEKESFKYLFDNQNLYWGDDSTIYSKQESRKNISI